MELEISTEYIKLDQLLKLHGIAPTGGIAKMMINDGIVSVNGDQCLMRGKKIRSGDTVLVEFEDETEEITIR